MRSNVTRRIQDRRSASSAGVGTGAAVVALFVGLPCSMRARTKASMGVRGQRRFRTGGTWGSRNGANAQCAAGEGAAGGGSAAGVPGVRRRRTRPPAASNPRRAPHLGTRDCRLGGDLRWNDCGNMEQTGDDSRRTLGGGGKKGSPAMGAVGRNCPTGTEAISVPIAGPPCAAQPGRFSIRPGAAWYI